MRYMLLLLSLAFFTAPLRAQDETPVPPSLPEDEQAQVLGEESGAPLPQDEELQPEVTIIHRGTDVVEEYRAGGQLYMIKITPSKGLPYYLIDTDGDGSLETRRNELDNPEVIMWRIFNW